METLEQQVANLINNTNNEVKANLALRIKQANDILKDGFDKYAIEPDHIGEFIRLCQVRFTTHLQREDFELNESALFNFYFLHIYLDAVDLYYYLQNNAKDDKIYLRDTLASMQTISDRKKILDILRMGVEAYYLIKED